MATKNAGVIAPKDCSLSVRQAIQQLSTKVAGLESTPTFTGLTLSGLTASRLLSTDTDKKLESVSNLVSWVAGTTNQVNIANDGDGTITLSLPQNIHTAATPTFARQTLTDTCLIAAGANFLRVTGLQADGTAMTGTLRGAYIDVSNGNTAATGTIRGMELKARTEAPGDTGNDVNVLEGLSISTDSKGHSVTTMRVAEFILDGSTGGTITEAVGLRIANNLQANKATTSYGLQIYRDSFDYTADIDLTAHPKISADGSVIMHFNSAQRSLFLGKGTTHGDIGNHNVFCGYHAGYSNNTTDVIVGNDGCHNVYIGSRAGAGEVLLTGTVTATNGSNAIVGDGTLFESELVVGDIIRTHELQGGYEIATITDDTHLTLTTNFTGTTNPLKPVYRERGDNYGNENIAIGHLTLSLNSTGYENTAVGDNALKMNTTGRDNCAFGNDAMQGIADTPITGIFNCAFGVDTLYIINSGSYDVAVGYQCLYSNTSGSYNTAMGYQALHSLTTANYNVAFGYRALYNDTIGEHNVAIGYEAGYYNDATGGGVKGTRNVYIGRYAGHGTASNSGAYNIYIGSNAGYYNTSGERNFFIGADCGQRNTSGYDNAYLGTFAGQWGTEAKENIAIGRGALYRNIDGNYNVVIGVFAGQGTESNSFSNNTIIGNRAGYSLSTGSSNIFLGKYAGYTQTTLSNLLIIDNQERADVATELSNAIVYGVMAAAPASQTLRINAGLYVHGTAVFNEGSIDADFRIESNANPNMFFLDAGNGRVAIGTGAPASTLSVAGNTSIGYAYRATATPTNGMIIEGNTGIGVTNPHSKLEVNGAISSAQKTCSSSSDAFDVTGVNSVLVNTSGGNVVLGGLSGGVVGQKLVITHHTLGNSVTLEANEAEGTQKFMIVDNSDETLSSYGGWTLVCDGTNWYECNHAKHV